MNKLEIELKDCPFCGEEPRLSWNWDEDLWSHNTVKWYKIQCSGCEISTQSWPESVLKENIIDVWNRRI